MRCRRLGTGGHLITLLTLGAQEREVEIARLTLDHATVLSDDTKLLFTPEDLADLRLWAAPPMSGTSR
jgi:hypothetical protein